MKPYTIKLSTSEMTCLAKWIRMAMEDISDDKLLLAKLVIADLFRRKTSKFTWPEACSMKITPELGLALSQWLDVIHPQSPFENAVLNDVFKKINNPLNEQLWSLFNRGAGRIHPGATTS